jgi:hypothetical protein
MKAASSSGRRAGRDMMLSGEGRGRVFGKG